MSNAQTEHGRDLESLGLSLDEQFEIACKHAAQLYAQGKDTAEADAEVDRLLALLEQQS